MTSKSYFLRIMHKGNGVFEQDYCVTYGVLANNHKPYLVPGELYSLPTTRMYLCNDHMVDFDAGKLLMYLGSCERTFKDYPSHTCHMFLTSLNGESTFVHSFVARTFMSDICSPPLT